MMETSQLQQTVERACRRLLSEQNRDPYAPAYGSFDRRYWSWKLVDYPEATFQRNVHPVAWILKQAPKLSSAAVNTLTESVLAGLQFAVKIQHKDGSFDQAFPNEHSFGATAFLVHALLTAYQVVYEAMPADLRTSCERCILRGADFLCKHDETHGHIANHLAGAVLSLIVCANYFDEPRYERRSEAFVQRILDHQSTEGWFLEYEGADPGYQTLCIYYLAQVYRLRPDALLKDALESAIDFLSWFVHPDGTFAGEYGSRRTAIYYPGGLAVLQNTIPLATSVTKFMLQSIIEGRTVTTDNVDMGNMGPLLSNYILILETLESSEAQPKVDAPALPWQKEENCRDFPAAGLYVRGTSRYYAVLGVSNGGVLKVFDRQKQALLWNDSGYAGRIKDGVMITSQMTDLERHCEASPEKVELHSSFYHMLDSIPTPGQFILLRLLNLTVMRNVRVGNYVKRLIVRLLISGKRKAALQLTRTVRFEPEAVIVDDRLTAQPKITLSWLEYGRPFVAIHMASSRYFEGFGASGQCQQRTRINIEPINSRGIFETQVTI